MAADVLTGNDANAARWIRANRDPIAEGEPARVASTPGAAPPPRAPEAGRRRQGRGRDRAGVGDRWSSSPRRAGGAAFAAGTTVLDAARALGVDIDSVCGGRGLCGRCQVAQGIGRRSPSTA